MNSSWCEILLCKLISVNRKEVCAYLILDLLRICPLNSSRLITGHDRKDEILPSSRLHWLPHRICSLSLVGNKDIFILVVPPLSVEDHEDLTIVGHLDRVEGIDLPLRQGWVELKEALL